MAIDRELKITYGAFVVGDTTTRIIHDVIFNESGPDLASVEFKFLVQEATEADFASAISAVETAFRTPRLRLLIEQGSATLYDYNPDDTVATAENTGFNQRPTITKREDVDADTGRSRIYTVRIEIDLPADVHGNDGRRDSRVRITFTPSRRRTMTVSGTYTALEDENNASTVYTTNIAAYLATLITKFGGDWDIISEEFESDDTDKICDFTIVQRDLVFNQSQGVLDHAAIEQQRLTVRPGREAPGDSRSRTDAQFGSTIGGDARRLIMLQVEYDADINKDVTTDLESFYQGTIRPYLINHALLQAKSGQGAVVSDTPGYDGPENRISTSMTILAIPSDSTGIFEYRFTEEDSDDAGMQFDEAWTGDPLSAHVYQGAETVVKTITEVSVELDQSGSGAGGGGGGGLFGIGIGGAGIRPFRIRQPGVGAFGIFGENRPPIFLIPPGAGGGIAAGAGGAEVWVQLNKRDTNTPLRLGVPGNEIDAVERTASRQWRLVKPIVPVRTFS